MTEIRSFRDVFDLERRIYRIDRIKLNPAGVPLRGIVYFLAILTLTLIAGRLPLLGSLTRILPWYLREIAVPGVLAALLTIMRIEGRPFHLAAIALLRYGAGPRELVGFRPWVSSDRYWCLDELVVLEDGSDSRLRRLRYTGPGAVHVNAAHVRSVWTPRLLERFARGPSLTLAPLPDKPSPRRGQVILLARNARLEVRR